MWKDMLDSFANIFSKVTSKINLMYKNEIYIIVDDFNGYILALELLLLSSNLFI